MKLIACPARLRRGEAFGSFPRPFFPLDPDFKRIFEPYLIPNAWKTTFKVKAKIAPPRSIQTGRVRTQAMRIFIRVFDCNPDRLAAMVPAMPEERIWVVLTGRPQMSAA